MLYQHLVRFHPTYPYPATDAEILANPLHLRMCATVFYDPQIPAPPGGRKGFTFVLGGGFQSSSGLPVVNYQSNPNFAWIDTLIAQGYAFWSPGYIANPVIGGTPPTSTTIYPGETPLWFPDLAAAQAALPGLGAFNPARWRYDDTTKTLRLRSHPGGVFDSTDIDPLNAEQSMVHWIQWVAMNGLDVGCSPNIAQDMVIGGRSAGAHLAQFLGFGNDRSDPEAPSGTRYAQNTRPAGLVLLQNVSTWNIYQDAIQIPHWTDYAGGLIETIGGAKSGPAGPNGEDQIALASPLYFADKDPDTSTLNATMPVYMRAGDAADNGVPIAPFPGGPPIAAFGYDDLDAIYGLEGAHPAAGVQGMRLLLQGLTPPTGEFNTHIGGLSQFFTQAATGPQATAEEAAAIVAFINAVFDAADPGFIPDFPTTAASTAKLSYLTLDVEWGEDPANSGQPFALRITDNVAGVPGYALEASMEVEMPREASGIPQEPFKIDLPSGFADLDAMARGVRYPKAKVIVREFLLSPEGQIVDERVIVRGFVRRALLNPKNANGRTLLEVVDELALTEDAALGVLANQFCQHRFGRGGCRTVKTDLVPLTASGNVQSIQGKIVTITGLPAIPSGRTLYWQRGSVRYAGLSLTIRSWSDASPNVFQLVSTPPQVWLGKTVTVVPGCLKSPDNCAEWDNEARFLGAGLAMPTYQPDYQQPPG